MNQEIKERWVATLRSGKYKQGRHALRSRGNQYCCLGVLCDIMDPLGWGTDSHTSVYMHKDHSSLPSRHIQTMAVLTDEEIRHLADSMNDEGATFAEIADYIEKNL